ncbi:MAG: hypothetical protein M3Z24_15860 [Chloroflexota bacterium]|nr:hypothetical protein [Chloroflexota bacterium]
MRLKTSPFQISHIKTTFSFFQTAKFGAILLLFVLSILIVACTTNAGGNNSSIGSPPVTVTINIGQDNGSPTPPLPAYSCNAWVTDTTPGLNISSTIGVYAKFTHNVDGNPQGIGGAFGVSTVNWPDGTTPSTISATTTSDGLAVFPVSIKDRAADLFKITTITVLFTKQDVPNCQVPANAAFFTLIQATPNGSAVASPPSGQTPPAGQTPPPSPSVGPTTIPTVCPSPPHKPHQCH